MSARDEVRAVEQVAGRLSRRGMRVEAGWLTGAARGLGRHLDLCGGRAIGVAPVDVPATEADRYRGLDLAEAVTLLAQRVRTETGMLPVDLGAEVSALVAAVSPRLAESAQAPRGVAQDTPDADGAGLSRQAARETSKRAAIEAVPRTGTQRHRVLLAVAEVARDPRTLGLTDVEVQQRLGLSPNAERPRRVELVEGGWLVASTAVRQHDGRDHTVWVLTARAEAEVLGVRRPEGAQRPA